jgi:putative hydrolase of the HAD superfamily
MVIKAIVFDIGDVILKENPQIAREIVSKKFNLDSEKFRAYSKKVLGDSFTGKLSYVDFFKGLIRENNLKTTPEDMLSEWRKARVETSSWIIKNKELLQKLNKNYLTISLTNSTKLNDGIEMRKEAYKLFKMNVISHEVGMKKPDEDIYQYLLEKLELLGVESQEIAYVDDKEENLTPAKGLGINVILLKEDTDLERELNRLGVRV